MIGTDIRILEETMDDISIKGSISFHLNMDIEKHSKS